jgi:hypothetical protein
VDTDADFLIEKTFDDFADDIEAVTIHYALSPLGDEPDWDQERVSKFMPLVGAEDDPDEDGEIRRRARTLKLPARITTRDGSTTDHYLLHHYFEYWQSGFRHYSPHYSEEINAGGAPR